YKPLCLASLRAAIRILIHEVLELVDSAAVRQKDDVFHHVQMPETFCGFAKKQFHPGISQKLHAHAVNFTSFSCGPAVFQKRLIPAAPILKGVTAFMRHDVHVVLRAIEIAEHKRRPKFWKAVAITSACFAFPANEIK